MKKIAVIILLFIVFVACHKDSPVLPGLMGKWELRTTSGGFAGGTQNYPKGNGNILQFTSTTAYKRYEANKLTSEGTYEIKKGIIIYSNEKVDSIYFDQHNWGDVINVQGTKLTIGTGYADGIVSGYEKISQ
jgi:hypothetical protein